MSAGLTAACTVLGALALSVSGAVPAQAAQGAPADYQPNSSDIVGVGSDTLQFILDFGADGDPSGDAGFNTAGNAFKIISLDATADENARFSYLNNSTNAALKPQNPTVVIRAQTFPILRPNGSGSGMNAMLADTAITDPTINFVRSSGTVTGKGFGATAVSHGWQGIQDFVLGHENLGVAAAATTNAPAGLSAKQLVAIYQCTSTTWTQVGGSSGNTIIPIIPQAGSGTRNTFLADLQAANGGVAITLGGCVITSEENDPTAITGASSPADAIAPFSGSRLNLWSGLSGNTTFGGSPGVGYFHDPTVAYPGGAALTPGVKMLATTGNASDGTPNYVDNRALHIAYRWIDQISTTPWQPGGTLNWAQVLFCNPGGAVTPFFQTAEGKLLIAEAGADPSSQSCLTAPITN